LTCAFLTGVIVLKAVLGGLDVFYRMSFYFLF